MKDARYLGQLHPVRLDDVTNVVTLLKACAKQKDLAKGFDLHTIIKGHRSLEQNCYVANTLVSMYARCGALAKAQQVLNELADRNTVTWNALIAGYARLGQGEAALECFHSMQREGHTPDVITFVCSLKACGSIGAVAKGEEIHETIAKLGLLDKNVNLGNALVDMYARCGALSKAKHVLRMLPVQNVVTWNALIGGYTQKGQDEEALKCFECMQHNGISPDTITFICALKACGHMGAVGIGEWIHERIQHLGMLQKETVLANSLVDMYARCGAVEKAQKVLNELPFRDMITWTALIAGYAQQGQSEEALKCFNNMQYEGHSPDAVAFICALNACASMGAAAKGQELHDKIVSLGLLENNIEIGSTLVDMYARCGALEKAQQVLDDLPVRNVIAWTALVAGYSQQGQSEKALKCFDKMQSEGHSPDVVTFVCALKACGNLGAAAKGEQIHSKVAALPILEKDTALGNAVVDMYARCGALIRAQQVVDELLVRDVVTWTALIGGYTQHGQGKEAMKCFDSMQCEGHFPNVITFICALHACGSIGVIAKGERIHHMIASLGLLEKDITVGSALVDMYARCGVLATARHVLNELPVRDVGMWTTIIAGYVQQGQNEEALKCFDSMEHDGHSPNEVTYICALKACGSIGAVVKGEEIHDRIVCLGMLNKDEKEVILGNSLVDMYAKCGALAKAQQVLDELPARNVITWTTLIVGYVQQGHNEEALKCFDNMQREGHSPDAVTFMHSLKACGSIGAITEGEKIHHKLVSMGMLEKDTVLGNTLVDMYARCGAVEKAQRLLQELPIQDVVTWNTLIAGYIRQGEGKEALECFDSMQHEGHSPDAVSFICALNACGIIGAATEGEKIHHKIMHLGMLEEDIMLGNALVDMYVKCGAFEKAQQVFTELPVRNVITWTSIIAGYAQQGQGEKALECFDSMQREGHIPVASTFTCAVKACGSIGAATNAIQIHDKIATLGVLGKNIVLGNALVSMYAKCAALGKAGELLEELPVQDVVTWNALLGGYAQQGQSWDGLNWFQRMQSKGVGPNSTTLLCLLNACSHAGLLGQAEMYFWAMSTKYNISPDVEHCCCMVDLFGRAGGFNKALLVIEMMPCIDYLRIWHALLGACCKWQNLKIGRLAFAWARILDTDSTGPYVSMANIYTAANVQEAVGMSEIIDDAWMVLLD